MSHSRRMSRMYSRCSHSVCVSVLVPFKMSSTAALTAGVSWRRRFGIRSSGLCCGALLANSNLIGMSAHENDGRGARVDMGHSLSVAHGCGNIGTRARIVQDRTDRRHSIRPQKIATLELLSTNHHRPIARRVIRRVAHIVPYDARHVHHTHSGARAHRRMRGVSYHDIVRSGSHILSAGPRVVQIDQRRRAVAKPLKDRRTDGVCGDALDRPRLYARDGVARQNGKG